MTKVYKNLKIFKIDCVPENYSSSYLKEILKRKKKAKAETLYKKDPLVFFCFSMKHQVTPPKTAN